MDSVSDLHNLVLKRRGCSDVYTVYSKGIHGRTSDQDFPINRMVRVPTTPNTTKEKEAQSFSTMDWKK